MDEDCIECLMDEIGLVDLGYSNYTKVFRELLTIYFIPEYDSLDEARCADVYGFLRTPYGYLEDDPDVTIGEVLIAMCIKVAYNVMGDADPGRYFWEFLDNLGLLEYPNKKFDKFEVDQIVKKWLEKSFRKNGIGSPFPIPNTSFDLRCVDMWRHCNLYVSENYV